MKLADKKTPLAVLIAVIVLIVGFSIYNNNKSQTTPVPTPTPQAAFTPISGTFSGKLPCADCEALQESITLTPASEQNAGTFLMNDTYIGKDVSYDTKGTYKVTTGSATDPNAQVLEITPEGDNVQTSYFLVGNNTLTMLDMNKKPIDSPFNETLTKN